MHISTAAGRTPDRTAIIDVATDERITFGEMDRRSNRVAHLLRDCGLFRGDHVAFLMDNRLEVFDIALAATRTGIYATPISTRLKAAEVAYLIADSGSSVFFASDAMAAIAAEAKGLIDPSIRCFSVGGPIEGFEPLEQVLADRPGTPVNDESPGMIFFYSSGSTGRPKGVLRPLPAGGLGDEDQSDRYFKGLWGFSEETVYLHPAPLYHSAPLHNALVTLGMGGTVLLLRGFDAEQALALIERYRVTHSQWVPTMFNRMLQLPEDVRNRYDLSSLKVAIHAAAPCPVQTKRRMIEWWGPILYEHYSATEGHGMCHVTSREWLERPGTVGRPLFGELHITNDEGAPLPAGETGTIYFGKGNSFAYHNDPDKTRASQHPLGWTTVGDVGYVDEDGYLFLTDRIDFMIISGGVNIYPAEAENILQSHPLVADVAVVGVPHSDFGEQVKAIVEPIDMTSAGPELEAELIAFCRSQIADVKSPRSVDFVASLPRLPTGKLQKKLLRAPYWVGVDEAKAEGL